VSCSAVLENGPYACPSLMAQTSHGSVEEAYLRFEDWYCENAACYVVKPG
jgi:hypothetical protein